MNDDPETAPVPTIINFAERIAAMEERMNTLKAENEGAADRLQGAFERLRADMAVYQTDAAKRETRLMIWIAAIAGLIIAAVAGFNLAP